MGNSCKTQQGQGAEQVGSSMEAQGDGGSLREKVRAGQEEEHMTWQPKDQDDQLTLRGAEPLRP